MTDYTIIRQRSPSPSAIPQFYQDGFFFNNAEHLCQQSQDPLCTIFALNRAGRQAEARCSFFVTHNRAISPATAPFGSVEFAENLPDSVLSAVVNALVEEARLANASALRLVSYPRCYAPDQSDRLTTQLLQRGFRILTTHPNFHLPITDVPFEQIIDASERRRLRKCRRAGFRVKQWAHSDVGEVMSFLTQMRHRLGYRLTISAERLTALVTQFPDRFPVFVVQDGATLAALTVAVRVRNDILYSFLPASHPDYRTFSPMVLLTDVLVSYCQQQQIRLLDLGVSLDAEHQPKDSLMRFKRNLGAQESPKLVFEKVL